MNLGGTPGLMMKLTDDQTNKSIEFVLDIFVLTRNHMNYSRKLQITDVLCDENLEIGTVTNSN